MAPDVEAGVLVYLKTRLPGLLFTLLNIGLSSYITGLGGAGKVFRVVLASNCMNAALDYAFVFGKLGLPAFGLQGAAIATVLGEFISLALYIALIHFRIQACSAIRHQDYFFPRGRQRFLDYLRVTAPRGFHFAIEMLSYFLFMIIVKSLGTTALATNSIILQLLMLLSLFSGAIGRSGSVFVAHFIGKGHRDLALVSFWDTLKVGLWYNAAVIAVFLGLNDRIIRIFSTDALVVMLFRSNLALLLVFNFFDSFQVIISNLLSGAGDTTVPALLALICFYAIQIPVAYLLAIHLNLGFSGAWMGYAIAVSVLCLLLLSRGAKSHWMTVPGYPTSACPE